MSAPSPTSPTAVVEAAVHADRCAARALKYRQCLDVQIAAATVRGEVVPDHAEREAEAVRLREVAADAHQKAVILAGGEDELARVPRPRTKVLYVRLTEGEHAYWMTMVRNQCVQSADLARYYLVRGHNPIQPKIVEAPAVVDAEAVRQLRAIGTLLNQVARRVNVAGTLGQTLSPAIRQEIERIICDAAAVVGRLRQRVAP